MPSAYCRRRNSDASFARAGLGQHVENTTSSLEASAECLRNGPLVPVRVFVQSGHGGTFRTSPRYDLGILGNLRAVFGANVLHLVLCAALCSERIVFPACCSVVVFIVFSCLSLPSGSLKHVVACYSLLFCVATCCRSKMRMRRVEHLRVQNES